MRKKPCAKGARLFFVARGGFFASLNEAQVPGKEVLYKEKP